MGKSNLSNGYIVFDWMVERLGMPRVATQLYAIIFDASMSGKRAALFSSAEAATLCKSTPQTVVVNLHKLKDVGLLSSLSFCGRRWKATIDTDVLVRNHIEGFKAKEYRNKEEE